jgi:hypothetical protein
MDEVSHLGLETLCRSISFVFPLNYNFASYPPTLRNVDRKIVLGLKAHFSIKVKYEEDLLIFIT